MYGAHEIRDRVIHNLVTKDLTDKTDDDLQMIIEDEIGIIIENLWKTMQGMIPFIMNEIRKR